MSKSRTKEARHVRLYHWLLNTKAWQSLTPNDRCLYIELATRYAGLGSNNGKIGLSVREAAAALHIGKSTASRAFEHLQERGFVVAMMEGSFATNAKLATEWRLTEFPSDISNHIATKEFMRWLPEKNVSEAHPRYRPVPVAGPTGTCSGTAVAQKQRFGT